MLIAFTAVMAACTSQGADSAAMQRGSGANEVFPSDDLMDWVSYPSQISVVTVVDETEQPPSPLVTTSPSDNVLVNRMLTLRIDRTLWSAPGTATQIDPIRIEAWGWMVKDGKRVKFGAGNGPRLEVGQTYLIPLVPFGDGWAPLSFSTVTPVVDGVASVGPEEFNPATRQIDGATMDELSTLFASTKPDPAAAAHMDLPPEKRAAAVTGATDQ